MSGGGPGGTGRENRRRYAGELAEISAYIRETVPPFGRRSWKLRYRIMPLLLRSHSGAVLALCRVIELLRLRLSREGALWE